MKKVLALMMLVLLLMATLCSCFDSTDTQNQGSENASGTTGQSGSTPSKSNLGNYNVVIESCRLAEDYEGDPIAIVKFKFTNNDDDPAAFWIALDCNAYQNDIGLNECYFVDDSANYSSDNQMKEIRKGASLSVEVAYELNDTTTDIEVEVSELISFSDKKITKTFSIK